MLTTQRNFTENILHFYNDKEVISFLSSEKSLQDIYNEMKQADGIAAVYPLVIPKSKTEFIFDLMMIIKHEKITKDGQWELFVAENFIQQKTNLVKLFQYIEVTTKTEIDTLLHGIQQELKQYRENFNLKGKTFVEIDGDKHIVAFGYVEK